jgi:hypothetical protein
LAIALPNASGIESFFASFCLQKEVLVSFLTFPGRLYCKSQGLANKVGIGRVKMAECAALFRPTFRAKQGHHLLYFIISASNPVKLRAGRANEGHAN